MYKCTPVTGYGGLYECEMLRILCCFYTHIYIFTLSKSRCNGHETRHNMSQPIEKHPGPEREIQQSLTNTVHKLFTACSKNSATV